MIVYLAAALVGVAQAQSIYLETLATFAHNAPTCIDGPAMAGGDIYNMTDDICDSFAWNTDHKKVGTGFMFHSLINYHPKEHGKGM